MKAFFQNYFSLCTVSMKKWLAVEAYVWLWLDAMCPCLAGVGWSRERAMPQGLHLPFGSCAWCLLDPLRATPPHWLIWQHGCDHRRGDRWAATLLSAGLKNTMSHNKAEDLLLEVCHSEFVLNWSQHVSECEMWFSTCLLSSASHLWFGTLNQNSCGVLFIFSSNIMNATVEKPSHLLNWNSVWAVFHQTFFSEHIAACCGKTKLVGNFTSCKLKVSIVIYVWSDLKLPWAPKTCYKPIV